MSQATGRRNERSVKVCTSALLIYLWCHHFMLTYVLSCAWRPLPRLSVNRLPPHSSCIRPCACFDARYIARQAHCCKGPRRCCRQRGHAWVPLPGQVHTQTCTVTEIESFVVIIYSIASFYQASIAFGEVLGASAVPCTALRGFGSGARTSAHHVRAEHACTRPLNIKSDPSEGQKPSQAMGRA